MASHRTAEQDMTIDGRDYLVQFSWTVEGWRENYGADADGRRGMLVDMRETDLDAAIVVLDDDGRPADLTPEQIEKVREELYAYIDDDDTYAQDDEPEPDYDRDEEW